MTEWMTLVMSMKKQHNCSLKEAMVHAKKVYKPKPKPKATVAKPKGK